ncbi:MAG: class I SAM-dependent methyltransferase [Rhodospirillales bacterium]|nr:class I SAM-dependent methyltransferase [Rhodospirillales bacterium]
MSGAKAFRRLSMGLKTLLGSRRQGFFIPYRYADSLPPPGTLPAYGALEEIFEGRAGAFAQFIQDIESFSADLKSIGENNPPQPRWDQVWFPRLDAAAAYCIVRQEKPAHIIEVGSGHSTRFMARAISDGGLDTHLIAIDPRPRANIEGLAVEYHRKTLHDADKSLFGTLKGGDILFIDSSHILMPGSDVDHLVNRILPELPAGALIHIHDIFLPSDYPAEWAWRGYNEQQGIAALIQGGAFEIVFASQYVVSRLPQLMENTAINTLPLAKGAFETSLWLRKKS